jgi:hypothetical protein
MAEPRVTKVNLGFGRCRRWRGRWIPGRYAGLSQRPGSHRGNCPRRTYRSGRGRRDRCLGCVEMTLGRARVRLDRGRRPFQPGNNPPAEPGALPSLAPQRGLSGTEKKSGRDLKHSSSLTDSAPERPSIPRAGASDHIGEEPTAGTVKPWLPPRQSRGPPSVVRAPARGASHKPSTGPFIWPDRVSLIMDVMLT